MPRRMLLFGLALFIGALSTASGVQVETSNCDFGGSTQVSEQGLTGVQIKISASVPQESDFAIQGADLFLVTDLALALDSRPAADAKGIEAALFTSLVHGQAHGAAIVFGEDLNEHISKILCNLRSEHKPGSFSPLPVGLGPRFSHIIFENKDGAAINANEQSLAVGINSDLLIIRGNRGSIEIGGNLPSDEPTAGRSDPAELSIIRVEGNSGTIALGMNHAKVEILNNSGEIIVRINRPLGVIEVRGNDGLIRVIENQGTIDDPTGTVRVGREP